MTTVPTTNSYAFFTFLDVLGRKTSKDPITKRNYLVVGTVHILRNGQFQV